MRHGKGPRFWWDSCGVQQGVGRVSGAWQRARGGVGPLWSTRRGWRHSGTRVGHVDGLRAQWDPGGAQGRVGKMGSLWGTVRIEHILSQWGWKSSRTCTGGEFTGDKTGPEPPGPNPVPVEGPECSRRRGHIVSLPGPQPGQPLPERAGANSHLGGTHAVRGTLWGHPTLCLSRIGVTQAHPWRPKVMEWMWLSEGCHQLWLRAQRSRVPAYPGGCAVLRQSPPDWHLGTLGCACPCCAPGMGL